MDELRIVLLGKQGAGKSASGNTLLRNRSFLTAASSERVTEACSVSSSIVNGQTIKVIDTPGWCDSSRFETDIKQEIINVSHPGPHVFLLVLPIGRFTNEEINTVMSILKEFGDEVTKYMIVLFTKGDDLEDRPIEDYLKEVQSDLKIIVQLCGKRYHVFNNRDKDNCHQVFSLLKKINKMVEWNKEKCFTTAMYPKVELCIKKDEQSGDKRRQQLRKEADDPVQDKSKSLSGSENGGRRNRCDAEEGKGISEDRKEQESWNRKMKGEQKSTQSTEHQGLTQREREEGKREDKMSGHSYHVDGRRNVEDNATRPRKELELRKLMEDLNRVIKENNSLKIKMEELHRKLEEKEGQIEQIKEELERVNKGWQQDEQKQMDIIKRLMQEKEEGKRKSMAIQNDVVQMEKKLSEQKTTDEKAKLFSELWSKFKALFG